MGRYNPGKRHPYAPDPKGGLFDLIAELLTAVIMLATVVVTGAIYLIQLAVNTDWKKVREENPRLDGLLRDHLDPLITSSSRPDRVSDIGTEEALVPEEASAAGSDRSASFAEVDTSASGPPRPG